MSQPPKFPSLHLPLAASLAAGLLASTGCPEPSAGDDEVGVDDTTTDTTDTTTDTTTTDTSSETTTGTESAGTETAGSETDTGEPVEHELPCGDPQTTPPTDALCPPGRQIANVGIETCPAPDPNSGWDLEVMFAGLAVEASLPNYCRYIWTDPGAPDPNTLPAMVQGASSADCRVKPQSPLEPGMGASFEMAFTDGLRPVLDPEAQLNRNGVPVHLAVVDTAPATTKMSQSEHGPTIAAIAALAAAGCVPGIDQSSCTREVETFLGLPQEADIGPNYDFGGYYGFQSDLAEGIAAAVDSWANFDERLVINLSVGWEPSLGDLDPDGQSSNAALTSVRDVVGLASCRGALVVAASGNQPQGSCVDQATGPGSWEAIPGFNSQACLDLGMPLADIQLPDPLPTFHPLLYAATPLNWSFENLDDYRGGSNARLATLGFAGTAEIDGQRFGPLSGSSVSTAAVSGIAAMIWSFYPTLSADELMDIIYGSGAPRMVDNMTVMASLHGPQTNYEQRVITACGALSKACGNYEGDPQVCAVVAELCMDPLVDSQAWWGAFDSTFMSLPEDEVVPAPGPAMTLYECERCGDQYDAKLPTFADIPAGDMPDPWVLPQPEHPPCPLCGVQDDDGYLSIDASYEAYSLRNVAITLYDATGVYETNYYGALPLNSGSVYVLTDSDFELVDRSQAAPTSGWIDMVFFDGITGRTWTVGNSIPVTQTP